MAAQKKPAKSKTKKKSVNLGAQLLLLFIIALSAVFLPTAFVLFVGLLPMFVAFFVDRSAKKSKSLSVGALNLAGCTPFLVDLWRTDHTMEKALDIVLDPMVIIVIYSAAAVGYIIDWSLSRLVASFLYERGQSRKAAIEKRQAELIERWGREVTGTLPLDEQGFPLAEADPKQA